MSWRRLALASYAALALASVPSCNERAPAASAGPRIVAIGGAVTETLFALGLGAQVVAVDTSSSFPEAVHALPRVGYQRTLAAETVLAFRPTLVLASHEAGPPAALAQLRSAGVRVEVLPEVGDARSAAERVRQLGELVGKRAAAAALARPLDELVPRRGATAPRVLFLFARGAGVAMVAGDRSPAATMIELAGGVNAVRGFSGYKPLSGEAVLAAAPEVVLVPTRSLTALGGSEALWRLPGLAQTPAGRAARLVQLDDLLLIGFGPRLADAVEQLGRALAAPSVL